MNKFLGRRSFLKSTGSAAALLGLAAVSSAKAEEKDIHWDQTVNYLIIGTGFAGLAAALESHYLGMKDVLVIDKMPSPGGNSIINGGAISAAGTDMQQKAGIKDSPDLLFADIMKAGGGLAHASLGRRIADESVANYEWLRDQIGVKFKAVTYHGGHSVPRSHAVQENSGAGFINPMLAKCKEFGIPIQLRTIVDELIVSPSGCVLGVKARKNYRMGRENSGKVVYIRSLKGVLIASGGFSQNVKMRSSHDPRLTSAFTSTNHPGATGEMIQHAQKIGANTIHMDWIQLGPWTSPDENGFGIAPLAVESMVGYGPMIDPATGKRFIKETGNRKVRADAIVALGHPALIYTTEENFMNKVVGKNMKQEQFETALKNNVIRKFDTLDELAAFYKVPLEALKETNKKFNEYMKAKKDPEFDCMFFKDGKLLEHGPYFALRLWPRVHHTMGGLEINDKAQVLDVEGKPIPGLYAAGEATGGVHGMVRLGTVAVADCMIFGRTATRIANEFKGC